MTAAMPDLNAGLHYASAEYDCTFGGLTISGGAVAFGLPHPVQFVFSFETGRTQPDPQKDLWDVTWDYSWFDQGQVEASIAVALSAICAAIGALLGVAQADVEQSVAVQRVWTFTADVQGAAAAQQLGGGSGTIAEVMPFPPQVSGADAAAAADTASVAVQ